MNDFLIYVDGRLVPQDMFDTRSLNSANKGRYLQLTAPAEKLDKKVQHVEVVEIRASSIVKRYAYRAKDQGEPKILDNEDGGKRIAFNCFGLKNSF